MASDPIIGGLVLFVQLNAAFIVFLLLIPPSRTAVTWLRKGRMQSKTITIADFARLPLYLAGLLFMVGTLVGALTGLWYPPVTVVWWIVFLASGMAQVDVAFLWAFLFSVFLVWTCYATLFKKSRERVAIATESS
jgi:hypothetical protein